MVEKHGAERILFGADSPWSEQKEMIALIRQSGLDAVQQEAVLGGNAAQLLSLGQGVGDSR